jgi:hypothetical protein
MRLFLDTEFNEFKGKLISIALVDEGGQEWYQSVGCDAPGPWVKENVMPIIGIPPVTLPYLQRSLAQFLSQYESVVIIADWPEDIAHFCDCLITGPGMRINTPHLTMAVLRDIDTSGSAIPHNALEDAKALRLAFMARYA